MAMEIDEPGSDFGSDIGPPPAKKAGTSRGKMAATSTVTGKKTSSSGRKRMVSLASHSAFEVPLNQVEPESGGEDDEEIDELPKSTTRSRRAAAPRYVFHISRLLQTRSKPSSSNQKTGKRASAANKPPAKAKQTTLSFEPSGATSGRTSTRAAAGRARGKMAVIVRIHILCTQILTATYPQADVDSD
jgi:double-strand break repair protein MRE11